MIKIGDTIICKKDFITYDFSYSKNILFNRYESYVITDIYSYESVRGASTYIQVYVDSICDVYNVSKYNYEKHFYNIREMRRLKIEKIENNKYDRLV